jgi:hypothetical protein
MVLQKRVVFLGLGAALMGGVSAPAAAAPWSRGYVVGTYEFAFHYGGRAGYQHGADIEPGVDCVHGSTRHFASEDQTRIALRLQAWRSEAEVNAIAHPPGLEKVRSPLGARFSIWNRAVAYRAWKKGIETYVNPFAAVDPGEPEVTGKISDGLNLDNNVKTGFVAPDGEKGIDNNLYLAWGCDAPWRGNGNATLDLRANDKMQEGLYTVAIRISGSKDPMNDDNAIVEIGYSPDKIIKDARGNVAADYSYRLPHTVEYTKLKAKIHNGVVDTEQVAELHMPHIAWFYDHSGDAFFRKGKLRLTMKPDGTLKGIIAGYRNWRDLYNQNTFAQDGGQQGIREHEDAVSLYYALKRNADGMLNPKTGQYDGISSAYRITAVTAYVVEPDKPVGITGLVAEEKRKAAYLAIAANMIKATTTRIPQPVPPGTSEASPRLPRAIRDLPNKEYFLATLDYPHYDHPEDGYGHELKPEDQTPALKPGTAIPPPPVAAPPAATPPAKQERQVRNETPAAGQ